MKISKKIISTAMAAMMACSAIAIGGVSASAATVKATKSVKASNLTTGVKVQWKKVKGAKSYNVYRAGQKIATVKKGTSYIDSSVKAGKNYTYKVKAVKGNKVSKAKAAKKVTRINIAYFSTSTNTASGVKLTWTGRKGADKFVIYRKTTGKYKKLATTSKKSYTDKTAVAGTKYTYKLYAKNSKTGSLSTGTTKSITALKGVTGISARQNASMDGVTLNWSKSKGATKYAIYRKTATGTSYKKIATVTATTYNDKSAAATNPTAYSYKVAAVKGSSESVKSDEKVVVYVPKSNGDNRYYTDAQNNAHVKLYLNKGDVYAEGKALADYLSLNGMYEAKVTEGADVVTVENGVITAKNAGTAVVEITVSDAAAKLVKDLNDGKILGLSNNTVFVEITVK